jgi:hypothetical protein
MRWETYTTVLEVGQQNEEALALHRGERTGGLVKHQDPSPGSDSGGDLEELLLAGGQFADQLVHVFIEAHF